MTTRKQQFTKVVLFTDHDGHARFRDETIDLSEGTAQSQLSPLMPAKAYQLRESPVGFRSQFHCTGTAQWVFILQGEMQIGLQDGSARVFKAGEHFYSADVVPAGVPFDPALHGHCSAQCGSLPLRTLFLRDS